MLLRNALAIALSSRAPVYTPFAASPPAAQPIYSYRRISIDRCQGSKAGQPRRRNFERGRFSFTRHPLVAMAAPTPTEGLEFIDIGANLLDGMFQGSYHGKEYHPPDLPAVLQRAWDAGITRMIITAGTLQEARMALDLAKTDDRLFCTVGVHPTRCLELEEHPGGTEAYIQALMEIIEEGKGIGKVVAIGECGLDYDRLQFCDKESQLKGFARQLKMADEAELPMFLHMRAAAKDFVELCQANRPIIAKVRGVVHSFDGTLDELNDILQLEELCIGINGCSLKTEENLAVMASVPSSRLMLETDCPWCDIRPSHASRKYVKSLPEAKDKKKHAEDFLVKGRNEPCNIRQVLEVVAGHRGEEPQALCKEVFITTSDMFFPK